MVISESNTISAIINSVPGRSVIGVKFEWQIAQPDHTYTIERGPLALELDRHNIARPAGLQWNIGPDVAAHLCVKNCFGEEFLETLLSVQREDSGYTAMTILHLRKEQRLEIARLQQASSATPPKLANWLVSFLSENDHPLANIVEFNI